MVAYNIFDFVPVFAVFDFLLHEFGVFDCVQMDTVHQLRILSAQLQTVLIVLAHLLDCCDHTFFFEFGPQRLLILFLIFKLLLHSLCNFVLLALILVHEFDEVKTLFANLRQLSLEFKSFYRYLLIISFLDTNRAVAVFVVKNGKQILLS
jgi:hypothetical protein